MVLAHVKLGAERVDGMRAEARVLQVVKETLRQHLCIIGAGVFEFPNPRVFDLGDDEPAGLAPGDVV